MSYQDKIRSQIVGGEPIRGDIRRFHLDCLLEIAKDADKEIKKLRQGESFMQDVLADADKELETKDKLITILKNIVDLADSGLMEPKRLAFQVTAARELLTKGKG